MFVKSYCLLIMFNEDNIFSSTEFQPFVLLEDILDRNFNDLLKKENITVSDVRECLETETLDHEILPIKNIKIEIKEEENIIVSDMRGCLKTEHLDHKILPIKNIKTEIKEEENSEHIEDMIPTENYILPVDKQTVIKTENQIFEHFEFYSSPEVPNEEPIIVKEASDFSFSHGLQPSLDVQTTSAVIVADDEDCSSLDLHLSPESVENDDMTCEKEDSICCTTNQSERFTEVSLNTPSSPPSLYCVRNSYSSRIPPAKQCSLDKFEESPDVASQGTSGSPSTRAPSSSRRPSSSSDLCNTEEDNRERQEEWNSQELSLVSQRMRLRSKQAKRVILEVIRKRQMADETLESFKKRLRRM